MNLWMLAIHLHVDYKNEISQIMLTTENRIDCLEDRGLSTRKLMNHLPFLSTFYIMIAPTD